MARTAIGIDFGTSTSLIAEGSALRTAIVPIGESESWLPSVVAQGDRGLLVGEQAIAEAEHALVRSVKRAITKGWTEVEVPGTDQAIKADDAIYHVLRELRSRAESTTGLDLSDGSARLGCPAMWNGNQRRRLMGLAQEAGIQVSSSTLIDEPIAAGVAWLMKRARDRHEEITGRVLVYDMGGGTLDVAVLDVDAQPDSDPTINVLAAHGIDEAGDKIDESVVADYEIRLAEGGLYLDELARPAVAREWVRRAARDAKVDLTHAIDARVSVGYRGTALPDVVLSRESLDAVIRPQLDRSFQLVVATLRAARLAERGETSMAAIRAVPESKLLESVNFILLAGGMSRTPAIAEYLRDKFTQAELHDIPDVAADEAIAIGLAETTSYERLSLHRPGFHFYVEWDTPMGPREHRVYEAYTPFYDPWSRIGGDSAMYYWHDDRRLPAIPTSGRGYLTVRSVEADEAHEKPIRFTDGDTAFAGIPVSFGRSQFGLRLAQDGSVLVNDGSGRRINLEVDRWPVLKGDKYFELLISADTSQLRPVPELPWHLRP